MAPPKWLFSEAADVVGKGRGSMREATAALSSRGKGRQFSTAVPRTGQTGSNWSSVETRHDAEAPLNTFLSVHYEATLRAKGATATPRQPAWLPTNPSRKPSGPGAFEGTFRRRPFPYIADVERKGPPPKLLHHPPQMLAKPPRRGGPGTAGRELTSFPYALSGEVSDALPRADKLRRPIAEPRGFYSGRPRGPAFDTSVYSMDAYRQKPKPRERVDAAGEAVVAMQHPMALASVGGVADLALGPAWRPTGSGKSARYPAHQSDPYDAGRDLEAQWCRKQRSAQMSEKAFDVTGTSASGPFGPARNHISSI
ncbi:hypothetical protein T492DRAFT_1049398 [Pavlovales sp. CCMP2436]|nr:hypothetical protein T492DRAFT_1049398 [Pavlovales sp. CCMP2436]|mmetsp:Transcript_12397/g.31367  ORF Transcript_12397/g.31367 Transcript_12397/m.31367 type:complete len:311 (-) Transcript_12397:134-1066(-)